MTIDLGRWGGGAKGRQRYSGAENPNPVSAGVSMNSVFSGVAGNMKLRYVLTVAGRLNNCIASLATRAKVREAARSQATRSGRVPQSAIDAELTRRGRAWKRSNFMMMIMQAK